jgi:hypothetical protein
MPALTATELAAAHEAAQMAIQQHCTDTAELTRQIERLMLACRLAQPVCEDRAVRASELAEQAQAEKAAAQIRYALAFYEANPLISEPTP